MDARRTSQSDRAHLEIRNRILDGFFAPAERLSETALSELLAVSRTPLREAIGRLVEEGLLERGPAGGCRVSSYSMQDIFDANEIRGMMEGLAARLAAERGVDAGELDECRVLLAGLDQVLSDMQRIDFARYVALNADFHQWIARAAASPIVMREIERVCRLPLASPSGFLSGQEDGPEFRASLLVAQAQHRAIFEAIESREGARAEALSREHARLARQNLRQALSRDREMASQIPGLSLVSAEAELTA